MPITKLLWTAVTWALGLGPLSLMAYGVPAHARKWLLGTNELSVDREKLRRSQ
jgi:hypothetical protein